MRFMVMVIANAASESGQLPSQELLTEMGAYNQRLADAGVLIDGAGLAATAEGARVRFSGEGREVLTGPIQGERAIAGYWLFETPSLESAIDWVRQCPNPTGDLGEIEIRRMMGAEDFAESDPTGELRQQEADLRQRLSA